MVCLHCQRHYASECHLLKTAEGESYCCAAVPLTAEGQTEAQWVQHLLASPLISHSQWRIPKGVQEGAQGTLSPSLPTKGSTQGAGSPPGSSPLQEGVTNCVVNWCCRVWDRQAAASKLGRYRRSRCRSCHGLRGLS